MVVVSSAGHSGAASAPWEHVHRHFAVAALLVARNAAYPSGGPKIDSHVDFDLTAAWRHHVSVWGGDPPIFVYRYVLECKDEF